MTIQNSVAVRTGLFTQYEADIGASPFLQIRTGAQAANCAAAAAGTLLAEYPLDADWLTNNADGTADFSGLPDSVVAVADGNAGHYRIVDNAKTTCHEQGSVSESGGGGDMIIDNEVIVTGQTVQVLSWSKTAPGA